MTYFAYAPDELHNLAVDVLKIAKTIGASDCVVELSDGSGLAVNVRKGAVETIEHHRDKSLGVTVYLQGQKGVRRGHASTSDFGKPALRATVQAAYDIARYTADDDCAGLPDASTLEFNPPDLQLFYPWALDATQAISLAQRAETAAFATSPQIRNSDGASVHTQHAHFVLANSRGFIGGYPYSRHSIACAPIAQHGRRSDSMQRDDWYSTARNPEELASPEAIGRYAAERALARLQARPMPTCTAPVLFEAPLAAGLLGSFVQAVSGGALYRRSSFLLDSLGKTVFPKAISIIEDPHQVGAIGSAPFDEEGCQTRARQVVDGGVLQGYFLSTYSARKLGMLTTGNAGGSHNLKLVSAQTRPADNFVAMLRKLDTGLLVTDLMGQGVNYVTGDYSRGAFGYWVEHGEIQYPVQELTIAGNLRNMFQEIVAVGADTLTRGTKTVGSILLASMKIAGT